MKFGHTIAYVQDVKASLAFFERAFGLKTSFLDEVAGYGELDTGSTALAFASHALMADLLPGGYVTDHESARPLGVEIGSP
ncbi:VOC family protein [Azonexus sp.]|uniref:VOC family protein n=1 Tax=Azonexus sp. TaxID=1872668 RepID=UPI0035B478BC